MRLASVSSLTICPQCGDDWTSSARNARQRQFEFCPRCGSPVTFVGYDPLRPRALSSSGSPLRVNKRTKFIVRTGILGLGMLAMFTGILLSYGGWLSHENLDAIQLWISRIGGPLLLVQGTMYCWVPFRRPSGAKIIPFRRPCV